MDDQHPRSLEEHSLLGVSGVKDMLVVGLRIREVVSIASETAAVKGVLLNEKTGLGLLVQDLCDGELTHHTLILLSVQVTVKD